jgi:hypothetical protein
MDAGGPCPSPSWAAPHSSAWSSSSLDRARPSLARPSSSSLSVSGHTPGADLRSEASLRFLGMEQYAVTDRQERDARREPGSHETAQQNGRSSRPGRHTVLLLTRQVCTTSGAPLRRACWPALPKAGFSANGVGHPTLQRTMNARLRRASSLQRSGKHVKWRCERQPLVHLFLKSSAAVPSKLECASSRPSNMAPMAILTTSCSVPIPVSRGPPCRSRRQVAASAVLVHGGDHLPLQVRWPYGGAIACACT